MGWKGWSTDSKGDKVNEKTTQTEKGSCEEYIRSSSGNRNEHSHVVVNKDSSGKITSAHSNAEKSKRN